MPLTKHRPGTPIPSVHPMRIVPTIRRITPADIHTCYTHLGRSLRNVHDKIQHRASSIKSRLTTESCKRLKPPLSFKRTVSSSPSTPPSTHPEAASHPFQRVHQAAKSLLRNLRNHTPFRPTQESLCPESTSTDPASNRIVEVRTPLPQTGPPPSPNLPLRARINRRALRKAIRRAPDLRSLRRRAPHGGFIPRVMPTVPRGGSENWSLDGSGEANQWGWVGENERGYVQFFVEPDLETVLEEGEGELGDGWGEEVWGQEVWEC